MREYKVIFCVFCGRERYMSILQRYINFCLDQGWIDEYHMMNFTRNLKDFEYIINLGYELKKKYGEDRIKVHHSVETEIRIKKNEKESIWNEFYKRIGTEIGDENSVIIKCDDDILFFDIYQFEKACRERWEDKRSWLIHSNCINNGVCAYYQRENFKGILGGNIEKDLEEYPRGGICGPLFEKPRIAFIQHYQFTKDLLMDHKSIKNYYLEKDVFVSTRISINFVFLHGQDIKEIQKVGKNDEYELSSKIPERLLRPNRILSDFITAHYSYGMQERLFEKQNQNYTLYQKLVESYLSPFHLFKKREESSKKELIYPIVHIKKKIEKDNWELIECKNPILNNEYYIKHEDTGLYLYYDIKINKCILSKENKSYFECKKDKIRYFIYPFTKYSFPNRLVDDLLYSKTIIDNREMELEISENKFEEGCKIKFKKSGEFLSYLSKFIMEDGDNPDLCSTIIDNYDRWIFEKVNSENQSEKIEVERIYDSSFDRYIYKNHKTGEDLTNPYHGWGLETLFS